jgi:uncharacterized membrane-anchored protein YjiN (DUF445 family)
MNAPRTTAHMKRLALGLLLAAALLYAVASVLQGRHPAWGYVAAFAEAAMVGAVADWFAVVALFRHPLGLPIPHTAIIPQHKDRIGENLATFLTTHFLRNDQVLAKLAQLDVPSRCANWLAQPANAQRVASQAAQAAQWVLGALSQTEVRHFVLKLAHKGLRQIDLAPLAGQVLSGMTHERRHQQLLDAALLQIANWMGNTQVQDKVTELIAKEVRALRYLGLDQVAARMATAKLVHALAGTLRDMVDDPQHDLRLRFDEFVADFIARLQHDPALIARAASWRDELLGNPAVAGYVAQLWDELMQWLAQDLQDADSRLRANLSAAIAHLGERLKADTAVRAWLQAELLRAAPALIDRYREDIRQYVVARVHQWDAQELSQELETHIGRDLQFIRINGTLVGGLIGLLIHTMTEALRHAG